MADHMSKFNEYRSLPVGEQAKVFLRPFVLEFQGRFQEILDIADDFTRFAANPNATVVELNEFEGHLFLEKRGEAMTVVKMREHLKDIDFSGRTKLSFIEYLMFKYHKTLAQLFAPPPAGGVPAALLAALDTAIDSYIGTKRAQQQRLEEMKRLEETAQSGKRTVQSVQAQNKIKELEGQEFSQKFAEMRALKAKKEAELAVANAPKIDPYEEEQKRLAEEQRQKEEAERKAKEESRNRLKNRAALFGN
ncbi:uncharacterized protein ACA1_052610 [Acanthamoeba castellanii str. Neff]|uniref:Calcium-regulated actin-bundling protein C-terminal domain-containing protein n=1 Tax=Acanthamoeba castellanii (strain ATCC 30010 / Neff) TaxID=1257118 RepID=L8H5Z9_ACACF|nr:uncharacterized protein ACA1_052610 [Acanthamoeba castellanii str. Neff]ELR20570.1 hypothetical protein ACA1_052610 [Acanthamoeba castellanii str. Neff]